MLLRLDTLYNLTAIPTPTARRMPRKLHGSHVISIILCPEIYSITQGIPPDFLMTSTQLFCCRINTQEKHKGKSRSNTRT